MAKYFTLAELTRSSTAQAMGVDNTPTPGAVENLNRLMEQTLDPLREAWGKPIYVNSGYRSAAVNKAVGGVATSHHLKGMAADITTGNSVDNRRLYQLAQDLMLPFTQLIGKQYAFGWLHISLDPQNVKRQPL